jgi:acetyl esterase
MSPTERIAPDARALIDDFRARGSPSFEKLGVEGARAAYERSCAANGIESAEVAEVSDMALGSRPAVPVRLYQPRAADDGGLIVFIHGGGWVMGSLETHDRLCRFLAHRTGSSVLAVDYRLAPEHPFPAALHDCRAVLSAVHAGALGSAPTRVALVGDSAGGGLAASLAAEWEPDGWVCAQVLLYPVADLTMSSASYSRVVEGFPLTSWTMHWFADLYAPDDRWDRGRPELSPINANQPETPAPAFVVTVGNDPLADEGIAFAGRLAASGGDVEHLHLAAYAHGLFTSAGKIPTAVGVLERVARFLAARLN